VSSDLRIGVFGGTFDPVHIGHLILAEQAREQLGLNRVLWVPAGQPWRKSGRDVSAAAHRVEMVRRAVAGNDSFELVSDEAEREGPSYTVETLVMLQARYAGAHLWLLLGADALADLPHWREPARLVELARLAVARREELEGAQKTLWPGAVVDWVEMPRIDVSATTVRQRVAAGRSVKYLVPEEVAEYIRERGLYR
jgi:nicotinate-nucleotide adenylyltransferase